METRPPQSLRTTPSSLATRDCAFFRSRHDMKLVYHADERRTGTRTHAIRSMKKSKDRSADVADAIKAWRTGSAASPILTEAGSFSDRRVPLEISGERLVFRFERRLRRRNLFGGGSEGGRSPPPSS